MRWCMPLTEAKKLISSSFDVVNFDGDSLSALLQDKLTEGLYLVHYLAVMGGEVACFAALPLGGQGA